MIEPVVTVRRRIVVAVDASTQSRAALEAAAHLADLLDADLSGIFVEDDDLLRLAQLPFAREVVPGLSSRPVVDVAVMERTLRNLAAQARAGLEELSGRHQISCSFTVARGQVLTELLTATAGAEIIVLGVRGRLAQWRLRLGSTARGVLAESDCSILMIHQGETLGTPVVALYEDIPGAERVLQAAADLARLGDHRVLVVAAGTPQTLASLQARPREFLGSDLSVEVYSVDLGQPSQLSLLLARAGCGVLVVSRDSHLLAGEGEVSILTHLRCPLLAVH